MKTDILLQRVEHLIQQGLATVATRHNTPSYTGIVNEELQTGFRAACLSFIKSLYGEDHPLYKEFKTALQHRYASHTAMGIQILYAIKTEISNGWLASVNALVAAEIFTDFLEMAEHLLEEGYKDAAAVMIGSTLEEHLRQLCDAYKVDKTTLKGTDEISKKADVLNADLKKAGAYNTLDQKQVTAWLGIRNSAAHGKYDEYSKEQVLMMYDGVLNFISRVK